MRYAIRLSRWFRPLAAVFGARPARSFVEIEETTLHASFGPLFDERFGLEKVLDVQPTHWPVIAGIGWRINFVGSVGLIGSTKGVVRIRLRQPVKTRLAFLPVTCETLFVSLEKPDDFADALRNRLTP